MMAVFMAFLLTVFAGRLFLRPGTGKDVHPCAKSLCATLG
jgi:hypothetical protein